MRMSRTTAGSKSTATRDRATAVGLVLIACTSPQIGAAFAITLFDELGPAGAAFLRLTFAAIVLWAVCAPGSPATSGSRSRSAYRSGS